jgi:DNA-binding XRE family transcriptional regulator
MNRKHIGSSFFDDVKRWEKEDPTFRKAVDEHIEKTQLAKMLKDIRGHENLSQAQLAEKAHIPQSVIARIETGSSRTLPRLDLFNKILSAAGYETSIVAKKKGKTICMALS